MSYLVVNWSIGRIIFKFYTLGDNRTLLILQNITAVTRLSFRTPTENNAHQQAKRKHDEGSDSTCYNNKCGGISTCTGSFQVSLIRIKSMMF